MQGNEVRIRVQMNYNELKSPFADLFYCYTPLLQHHSFRCCLVIRTTLLHPSGCCIFDLNNEAGNAASLVRLNPSSGVVISEFASFLTEGRPQYNYTQYSSLNKEESATRAVQWSTQTSSVAVCVCVCLVFAMSCHTLFVLCSVTYVAQL